MENQEFTYEQVVGFTLNILCGIMLPAEFAESIGVPIAKAIGNLRAMKNQFEKDRIAAEIAKEGAEDGRNAEAK